METIALIAPDKKKEEMLEAAFEIFQKKFRKGVDGWDRPVYNNLCC
ncbi:MAG: hypothetical protein J6N51_09810 [Selenomonas sp.]|nr:hypothetical protein [Selenomonas sp.]